MIHWYLCSQASVIQLESHPVVAACTQLYTTYPRMQHGHFRRQHDAPALSLRARRLRVLIYSSGVPKIQKSHNEHSKKHTHTSYDTHRHMRRLVINVHERALDVRERLELVLELLADIVRAPQRRVRRHHHVDLDEVLRPALCDGSESVDRRWRWEMR